jgi:hypothetical protein
MNTVTAKVIFNMPAPLKAAAQKRARSKGITLTEFLNAATKAFVNGDVELGTPELHATPQAIARFKKISADVNAGKNLSPAFTSVNEIERWLNK